MVNENLNPHFDYTDLFVKNFVSEEYDIRSIDYLMLGAHKLRSEFNRKQISNLKLIRYALEMYVRHYLIRLRNKRKRGIIINGTRTN